MSDQYNFTWSNLSKTGFTVLPQTKDTTSTSLTITGRGSPNWGQDLQENLLWLLESFASGAAPVNPTLGQLWYDTINKKLRVYDPTAGGSDPWVISSASGVTTQSTAPSNPAMGDLWFNPSGPSLSMWDGAAYQRVWPNIQSIKVAYVTEYNAMATLLNTITGTPQGSTLATAFGWGQTGMAIPATETVSTMTNAKWSALLTKVLTIANYLGLSTTGVNTDGFMYINGSTLPYGIVTMQQYYTNTLALVNSFSAGTTRFTPAIASMESSIPASGTAIRSTTWSGTISHEVTCTFVDKVSMDAYFNAGSQIQFISGLSAPLTGRDYDMQTFLSERGTIAFRATGTRDSAGNTNANGYYDLIATYKTIFLFTSGNNTIQVSAKLDDDHTIHFKIDYTSPGTLYGGVGGTLSSGTTLVRPSPTILNSPVLANPTVTQSALA